MRETARLAMECSSPGNKEGYISVIKGKVGGTRSPSFSSLELGGFINQPAMSQRDLIRFTSLELWEMDREEEEELGERRPVKNTISVR